LKSKDQLRYGKSYPHINFGEDWPRKIAYLRISIWRVIKVINLVKIKLGLFLSSILYKDALCWLKLTFYGEFK
jgi:hypothetical protein